MSNMFNEYDAIETAVNEIGLDPESTRVISLRRDGDCCELVLRTDWVMYECYVELFGGELVGLNTEPFVDVEAIDGIVCAELLDRGRHMVA